MSDRGKCCLTKDMMKTIEEEDEKSPPYTNVTLLSNQQKHENLSFYSKIFN